MQTVKYSSKQKHKIYVCNIPRNKGRQELLEGFRGLVRGIEELDVTTQKDQGRPAENRGFCFLEMYNQAAAEAAMAALAAPGLELCGVYASLSSPPLIRPPSHTSLRRLPPRPVILSAAATASGDPVRRRGASLPRPQAERPCMSSVPLTRSPPLQAAQPAAAGGVGGHQGAGGRQQQRGQEPAREQPAGGLHGGGAARRV